MIRAERTNDDVVAVEVNGDKEQNENELIAILISALSAFSEDEILQMLAAAVQYHNTGKTFDGHIN